jgi:hypothetical protein
MAYTTYQDEFTNPERAMQAGGVNYGGPPKTFLAAGGLVKKVVEQQRQRMLPKMAEGPKYMAAGGPVCKADGGPVTAPRPTTMAEDTVDAKLHPDEYVIPAEVVRKKGVDFFDRLVMNAQGERKGIVPVMKGGTMYAFEGGTGRDALDEDKSPIPLNTQIPKPAMLTDQVDSAVKNVNADAPKQAVQDANARINATKIPLNTDTVKTGESALSRGVSKAIDAVNPKNFSPETQSAILKGGDAMLEGFKGAKQGLVGAVKSAGSQIANPANQKAFANVASLGIPAVVDTVKQKGLVGAANNVARFLTGNTESGKKFEAAVEAQSKKINDALLYGSEGRPGTAKPTTVSDNATGAKPAVDTAQSTEQPTASPALYTQETLPDGTTRTALTAAGYQKAFGNDKPMTPEQIAAKDAADAELLAAIEAQDAGVATRGQAGFDPVEQYKKKLAADLEYQKDIAALQELQFLNYGQVFPGERGYGQVDNSPVTKQMEIDAANKIAATPGNPEFSTDKYGRVFQTKGSGADKFNQSNAQQQGEDQAAINAAKSAYFNMQPPGKDEGEEAQLAFKQKKEKLENFFRTWDPDTAKLIDKQKIAGLL